MSMHTLISSLPPAAIHRSSSNRCRTCKGNNRWQPLLAVMTSQCHIMNGNYHTLILGDLSRMHSILTIKRESSVLTGDTSLIKKFWAVI